MKTMRCSSATAAALVCVSICLAGRPASAQADFRRGDANQDGKVDFADMAWINHLLCVAGVSSTCYPALDADNDGEPDHLDISYLFQWLYVGAEWAEIEAPGPFTPGQDPTPDAFPCETYEPAPPPVLADVALQFDGWTMLPRGPGEPATYQTSVSLSTWNNTTERGAEGWSLSIGGENLTFLSATVEGPAAEGENPCRGAEVVDPSRVVGGSAQGDGAVSAVVLSWDPFSHCQDSLPQNGEARLLSLTFMKTDPGLQSRLFFQDGKVGSGQPISNAVIIEGTSQTPSNLSDISLGAEFRRGDANSDGKVDLADAAFLINYLYFYGKASTCEDAMAVGQPNSVTLGDPKLLWWWIWVGDAFREPEAPGPFTPGPEPDPEFAATCDAYEPAPPPRLAYLSLDFE